MSVSNVFDVDSTTFDSEVNDDDIGVVVDFWAPWCGPCRAMSPVIDTLAEDFKGKVKVLKVNVESDPDLARSQKISALPTIVSYKNGEEGERIVGFKSKDDIEELFKKLL